MELDKSTWMLIFFILLLVVSIWKIYAFLPNEQLEDDDTTDDAKKELTELIIKVIQKNKGDIDAKMLYVKVLEDEEFDNERFWRFNHNRLNRLLELYYLQNEEINSIKDIYEKTKVNP